MGFFADAYDLFRRAQQHAQRVCARIRTAPKR
jgi:hypothetical protein